MTTNNKGFFIWISPGPNFDRSGHSMVSFYGDVAAFGGTDKDGMFYSDIYLLSCSNYNCLWSKMKQSLFFPRTDFVAGLIPDSLIECYHK